MTILFIESYHPCYSGLSLVSHDLLRRGHLRRFVRALWRHPLRFACDKHIEGPFIPQVRTML